MGEELKLCGESIEYKPRILEKQTERVKLSGGLQGLAGGYWSKIQVTPFMVRVSNVRSGEPAEPHKVGRTDGEDVRRAGEIRREVRDSGAEEVCIGVFQVEEDWVGSEDGWVKQEIIGSGKRNGSDIYDPYRRWWDFRVEICSGGDVNAGMPRSGGVAADQGGS